MVLDVPLDSRIHARIIGGKGSNLRRLMDRYKVDIRFPRRDDENPNLVTITGDEENVYEAEAELKRLEDNYVSEFFVWSLVTWPSKKQREKFCSNSSSSLAVITRKKTGIIPYSFGEILSFLLRLYFRKGVFLNNSKW